MRDRPSLLRGRIFVLCLALLVANLAVWGWALAAFRKDSILLGTAALAYGLGLRHAVDADHIAAIDNVTRNLMQRGRRPVGIGLFFSLGHSTIVVLASVALALTATAYRRNLETIHLVGGVLGTLVSAIFLFAIAAINISVLRSVVIRMRRGARAVEGDADWISVHGSFLGRLLRPLFGLIRESWHMYPLGILFGLGFDTATEISLLGISAAESANGLALWSMLVFPVLFTVGMSLIDAIDSVMMQAAYGWAFVKPARKLFYNLTVTGLSVLVALTVGAIEVLGLIGRRWELNGEIWLAVRAVNDNFGTVGYVVIGLFVACWIASALFYCLKGYGKLESAASVS